MTEGGEHDYIVEFTAIGRSVKVTAIDPVTMKEVSMIGAKGVGKEELMRLAVRKLEYVIKRDKKTDG